MGVISFLHEQKNSASKVNTVNEQIETNLFNGISFWKLLSGVSVLAFKDLFVEFVIYRDVMIQVLIRQNKFSRFFNIV